MFLFISTNIILFMLYSLIEIFDRPKGYLLRSSDQEKSDRI